MEKSITSYPLSEIGETFYGITLYVVATLRRNLVLISYFPSIATYKFFEFSVPDSNYYL